MAACGIDLEREHQLHEVDLYTSHEGLILPYEEALSRRDSLTGQWYDCSAHLLWIGERTRDPEHAHVEFFAGVGNPIACKVGPKTRPEDLVALCDILDPDRDPGRLTLIMRLGADRVEQALPPLIRAVTESGHPVVWASDPMHGNGLVTAGGIKTRRFDDIMRELTSFFAVCRAEGVWPGGMHLEFTGDNVTECVGGVEPVAEDDLGIHYSSLVDPRLNARQSLDVAFQVAELLRPRNAAELSARPATCEPSAAYVIRTADAGRRARSDRVRQGGVRALRAAQRQGPRADARRLPAGHRRVRRHRGGARGGHRRRARAA